MNRVLEFAHVSRPVVMRQGAHGAFRKLCHPLAQFLAEHPEEVEGQRGDVVLAIAQRRHLNRKDVDAIVQILAERSFGHHNLEILVGRGDQSEIRALRARVPHRLEFPFLDDAQKLGLGGQGNISDFVQKQGSASGHFEHSLLVDHGAGERTLDVPEHFAFQKIFAQRIAVHGHEGLVLAQAVVVDRARNQFLPGSALAGQHDRAVRGRALCDQPIHVLHLRTRADDVLEAVLGAHLAAQLDVLLQQLPPFQRAFDHQLEFVRIKRLGQIVESAQLHRLHRGLYLRQAGDHDDVDIRVRFLHPAEHFQAVHFRHHDVQDEHIEVSVVELSQRLDAVLGRFDFLIPVVGENAHATPDDDLFIVDDQYPGFH